MLYTKEVVCLGSDSEAEYIEHAEKLRQVKAVLEEVYFWIYLFKFSYIYVFLSSLFIHTKSQELKLHEFMDDSLLERNNLTDKPPVTRLDAVSTSS